MKRNHTIGKRLLAMVLALAMITTYFPFAGLLAKVSAADNASAILKAEADAFTLHSWQDVFHPTNLNTEHAGGIWTDKSVITAENIANAFGNANGLTVGQSNFLVALSALGANSVIVGQGSTPTDTVFVLDVSGSMSSTNLRAMVAATNDAIRTLLSGNDKNRVGVVLYASSASVLLPLDQYTPVTETQGTQNTADDVTEYIEYSGNSIRAARVQSGYRTTYIKNGNGRDVTTSLSVGGGTYIQGGLYQALKLFNDASVTDNRAPALVLMSDGAPTFVTNDFNNVPNSSEYGDGNSSGDGEGFLTQLTAAYVKAKIAEKYSSDSYEAKAYLYTLGLGVSNANNVGVAEAVLDTTKTRNGIDNYWNTYLGLANASNKNMSVTVYRDGFFSSGTETVSVAYNAALNSIAQKAYVDKYFSASDASDLSAAFKSIVNEISLKSSYYVTRLDGQSANMGGYVTFVDQVGTGMEVKEIKGILIGNTLYTGELMAKAVSDGSLGTENDPTSLGDNMVWALIQRLDIKATENETAAERAKALIGMAYAAGQLSYDAQSGQWSNYIGWFGDANGDYIGFWDAEDPDAVIPENAAYANICYGMLGATTDGQTTHASDMMYVAVQISKPVTNDGGKLSIQANSPQTVTFRIPASLLPTVTYQIQVEVGSDGKINENAPATIAYNAADPIRLVYEVGVHSQLTPENIREFVRKGYQAKDDNGNYYLYTNAWYWEGADAQDWKDTDKHPQKGDEVLKDTGKNAITYAYFEPGEENEHYYFTEDEPVYVKNGNSYVLYQGNTQPSGTGYQRHLTFKGTANGQNAVAATVNIHYEQLSEAALLQSRQSEGANTWYVPEGTMHRNTHDHDRMKDNNDTGSFYAVHYQLVDTAVNGDLTHHYEIVYLGNNGRITYAPAQGFVLNKVMAEGAEAEGQTFTFTLTVEEDTDGNVTLTREGVRQQKALVDGKLQLTLEAGQSLTVTGLDTGARYTVKENASEGYKLSAIAARVDTSAGYVSDVVEGNQIQTITFTNDIEYYGSLEISKQVEYLKNSRPATANTDAFTVKVTLDGMGGRNVYVDGAATTLANDSTYTFTITDGKTVRITGVPEGTAYTVEEVLVGGTQIPAGYAQADGYTAVAARFIGTIDANETDAVKLVNQYEPADVVFNDVAPRITVHTGKTVIGQPLNNWSFDFELLYYNGTIWEPVVVNGAALTVTVDQAEGSDSFSLSGVRLSTVGKHYFRVAEIDPRIPGMTYDRTFHDFEVVVVDDLSGQLKIESVNSVQHAQVTPPAGEEDVWDVSTSFENEYEVGSTSLTIQAHKLLWNITGGGKTEMAMQDGQFRFTLYTADENFRNLVEKETTRNGVTGQIVFSHIPYHFDPDSTETTYYYVVKETPENGNGITVDDAVYNIAVTVKQVSVGNASEMQITAVTVNGSPVTLGAGNVLNSNAITFENFYEAQAATGIVLEGNKTLTGKTLEDNMFQFLLEGPNGYSETVFNKDGKFTFTALGFRNVGTYTYTIREVNGGTTVGGVAYDGKTITVEITVEDNGMGQLIAKIGGTQISGTYQVGGFTNTYKAQPVTGIVLEGTKLLQVSEKFNRTMKTGEFRFIMTKPDGSTETVVNDANGGFRFAALSFNQAGSYTYTISEVNGGGTTNGVKYDGTVLTVTIVVEDPGNGQLIAKVADQQITGTYHAGTFVNMYEAQSVAVQLTGQKYLDGDRQLRAEEFSFTLTKPDSTTETVKNDAEGKITFAQITFDSVGKYVYKIVEDKLDDAGNPLVPDADGNIIYKGVTYSQAEYTVTVTVTDNGNGQLLAHVVSEDAHGNHLPVQFFNHYDAVATTVTLSGEKTLNDLTSKTDKTLDDFAFRFQLTDETGKELETVLDNGSGFSFAAISFTEKGEYVYYIREVNDEVSGVIYDTTVYKVTVTVTDNVDEGKLEAAVSYEKQAGEGYEKADKVAFANTYKAKETQLVLEGLKTLNGGRPLAAGEFSFLLTDEAGKELQIVTNGADGIFTFEPIGYTEEGKYVYTLAEVQGTDTAITYDATVYTLTVTVADVNGQLQATVQASVGEETKASYGFTNLFTPKGATTEITIEKILTNLSGKPMGKDGFLFDLYCKETGITDTAESGTDGLAKLELSFTTEDIGKTYTYTLTERKGDNPYMTYSEVVYEIQVAVTQDTQTGELVLTVTRDGREVTGNAQFENILHPENPKTGEELFIRNWVVLMGISAVGLLAVLVLNKKLVKA